MSGKAYVIEFIGTLGLVIFASMARITNQEDLVVVSITIFFLTAAFAYTFFRHSGSQFNPVLTLSLVITKQIEFGRALVYVLCQLAGSFLGAAVVYLIMSGKDSGDYIGAPQMNAAMRWTGLSLEVVAMFMLNMVYNYFNTNPNAPKNTYGVSIGGIYMASIASFGFVSGGCVNFSFVFGPTIFMGYYDDWGFYLGAHLIGGILSGVFFRLFLIQDESDDHIDDGPDVTQQKVKTD